MATHREDMVEDIVDTEVEEAMEEDMGVMEEVDTVVVEEVEEVDTVVVEEVEAMGVVMEDAGVAREVMEVVEVTGVAKGDMEAEDMVGEVSLPLKPRISLKDEACHFDNPFMVF